MRNLFFLTLVILIFAFFLISIFRRRGLKNRKTLRIGGSLILIIVLLYLWSFPSWDYPETTGAYGIASVTETYVDENRVEPREGDEANRWVNVQFWYPQIESGKVELFPLVVFSHGAFGIRSSNESLYRELASHGYVVASIDHTYYSLYTTAPDGKKVKGDSAFLRQVAGARDSNEKNRRELYELFSQWMDVFMGDMGFVLDRILLSANANHGESQVYNLIDGSRVGVMGHSMGGAAALGIGRIRQDVHAVIALESPFMYDVLGVEDGDFIFEASPYPLPLLSVYTDSAWRLLPNSPQYAQNYAVLKDDLDTTHDIYVRGAGHMSLTDLAYTTPTLCLIFGQDMFWKSEEHIEALNESYLKFFNSYLKDAGPYEPAVLD